MSVPSVETRPEAVHNEVEDREPVHAEALRHRE